MAITPEIAAAGSSPPSKTATSKTLSFKKQNTNLLHVPRNYRIQKRPIPRAPIASPYAGNKVAKLVYVSSKTPFMSAVKRVQKLLRTAERRAMMPVIDERQQRKNNINNSSKNKRAYGDAHGQQQDSAASTTRVLEKCQQRLREDKVLVKATGRAIEKALEVGRWFEMGKGKAEDEYEVEVRTGSVCVVDDIVEDEGDEVAEVDKEDENEKEAEEKKDTGEEKVKTDIPAESKNQRRRRRKRERIQQQRLDAFKDEDGDPPESRTRWVNMVEIAINIK